MNKIQKHNQKHQRSNFIWGVLLLALCITFWTSDDAADELQAEQDHYCKMVAEGTWPDYKDTYEESCK